MTRHRARTIAAQFFVGIAYLFVTLQWLWLGVVGLPPLVKSGALDSLLPTEAPAPVAPTHSSTELSPLMLLFVGGITLAFLLLTVVIMIRLPRSIAKTGEKAIHHATEAVVPVVTHHQKLPAKKRRELSGRIAMALQLLLVAIPFGVAFLLPQVGAITHQIIITLATWLAAISLVCFIASWLLRPGKTTTSRTQSRASRG